MRFGMLAAAAAALVCAEQADAALTFSGTETSSGVTFSNQGSINLAGLSFQYVGFGNNSIDPSSALISPSASGDVYGGIQGPSSWGPGGATSSTMRTGDVMGVSGGAGLLILPVGYVSGATLSGTYTFAGATFASLGINSGVYTYTFGSGANADTVTVRVPTFAAAVPETATWAMMILGMGAIGYAMRRRRAKVVFA